jgi:magnesium-transporting ATPase (P-type)
MSIIVKKGTDFKNKILHLKNYSMESYIEKVYLDGKLKEASLINEQDKSFGVFMHSLILSNTVDLKKYDIEVCKRKEDKLKKAVSAYAGTMGFDTNLIESIAPKLPGLDINHDNRFSSSVHLINGELRVVIRGAAEYIFRSCTHILMESRFVKVTRKALREAYDTFRYMVAKGFDVYAIALRDLSSLPENYSDNFLRSNLALVSLIGVNKRLRANKNARI